MDWPVSRTGMVDQRNHETVLDLDHLNVDAGGSIGFHNGICQNHIQRVAEQLDKIIMCVGMQSPGKHIGEVNRCSLAIMVHRCHRIVRAHITNPGLLGWLILDNGNKGGYALGALSSVNQ